MNELSPNPKSQFFILISNLSSSLKTPSSSSTTISETHLSNSTTDHQPQAPKCLSLEVPFIPTCTNTPPSLANALIHYATTNITPQQTFKDILVSARILAKRTPCNFLVFGLGRDSLMWAALNYGGSTVFLKGRLRLEGSVPATTSFNDKIKRRNGRPIMNHMSEVKTMVFRFCWYACKGS
ncbi:putative glucuronoxylan 4-O-methyltransferase [Rosa chinensis]|uniref:Putative glucuronoxylan 4-O-methyltransferase n=1 Tax=Rosa chinensis TaxID=74649 RepID=A0A2P6RM59_ROSCH|nr:putative glucuronoxylan 4-O-methyltransferase [Rosa chinensis]